MKKIIVICSFFVALQAFAQEKWKYYHADELNVVQLFAEEDTIWMALGKLGLGKFNMVTEKITFYDYSNTRHYEG